MENDILVLTADLCHRQWSGWMIYLFDKSTKNDDGSVTIPKDLVDRWFRQMNTDYRLLSESEQNSDIKEAKKFIELLSESR